MAREASELAALLGRHGQQHVLAFWDKLSARERVILGEQIAALDFGLLERAQRQDPAAKSEALNLEPEPFIRLPYDAQSVLKWRQARHVGQEALAAGRVAAMVVAGGQGTRLGFDGPKGAFPIGPISRRTLFQIHAEKVLAASRRYAREIPFLIMTGPSNDSETKYFFKQHGFFGLPHDSVKIFQQSQMPAVDMKGKLILDAPDHIFVSPDGHGGSLKALWDCGIAAWLEQRGVDTISYFQVDNPLVSVLDPCFIGFHIEAGAEMSLKLLERSDPDEKLGIWVNNGGAAMVIEYSDMPEAEMHACTPDGSLKYPGGSIAIHCFDVGFVRRLNEKGIALPYHRARKKVAYLDSSGALIQPDEPNATKFEMFVFDALLLAKKTVAVETARAEEFSPVKNAEGADSPETARRDMARQYARWLHSIGVTVRTDANGDPADMIEISPLVADDSETLRMNYCGPNDVRGSLLLAQ